MQKPYKIIECDVDGVLYDINALIHDKLNHLYGLDLNPSGVSDYGYKNYSEDIRKLILKEFSIPQNFGNIRYIYENAFDILTGLGDLTEKLIIRTLVEDKKCRTERYDLIQYMIENARIDCRHEIIITDIKNPIECDILAEDNPSAINKKTDGTVLIRRQSYNIPCFDNPNAEDLEIFLKKYKT